MRAGSIGFNRESSSGFCERGTEPSNFAEGRRLFDRLNACLPVELQKDRSARELSFFKTEDRHVVFAPISTFELLD
jgi:hypothetical protein